MDPGRLGPPGERLREAGIPGLLAVGLVSTGTRTGCPGTAVARRGRNPVEARMPTSTITRAPLEESRLARNHENRKPRKG